MSTIVPAVKTPVTCFELQKIYTAQGLKPDVVDLLIAHTMLETGWAVACYLFNLGNQKGVGPSGKYCMRECGEELPASAVDEKDPRVKVVKRYERNGRPFVSANFVPDHPQCKFAAFDSLEQAVLEHLSLLQHQFPKSWIAAQTGNAKAYGASLAAEGYYTADVNQYSNSLAAVLAMVKTKGVWWSFTPNQQDQVGQRVLLCCHSLLDAGPIGEKQRPLIYRSFINAEQYPAGYLGAQSVGSITGWRTSCALFVRAVLYWVGRLKTPVARNASGIFTYLGLDYWHPAWVENDGKNVPKTGDIFYKSGTRNSNDGHTGIFLDGEPNAKTAEGGHGDGTTCELDTMVWDRKHKDKYGRTVWGWWDCNKLGIAVKPNNTPNNEADTTPKNTPPDAHDSPPQQGSTSVPDGEKREEAYSKPNDAHEPLVASDVVKTPTDGGQFGIKFVDGGDGAHGLLFMLFGAILTLIVSFFGQC